MPTSKNAVVGWDSGSLIRVAKISSTIERNQQLTQIIFKIQKAIREDDKLVLEEQ